MAVKASETKSAVAFPGNCSQSLSKPADNLYYVGRLDSDSIEHVSMTAIDEMPNQEFRSGKMKSR